MKTAEYRQENIDRVLDLTLELCEEIGIAAVNNTKIASKANLSTKSIQRYFADKTDLIYQVSAKIIRRNFEDIMREFRSYKPETLPGIKKLELFLKSHNNYTISHFREIVFIQDADLYCRFNTNEPEKYMRQFKRVDSFQEGIQQMMNYGVRDGSIDKLKFVELDAENIALIAVSLIEHLVGDVHCKRKSIDSAIEFSNRWIDSIVRQIANK